MERAEKDFNLSAMLVESRTWQEVAQLVTESPHKFDRDQGMACEALERSAALIGRLGAIKKASDRAAAKAFIDRLSLLIVANMGKMRAQEV